MQKIVFDSIETYCVGYLGRVPTVAVWYHVLGSMLHRVNNGNAFDVDSMVHRECVTES